MHGGALNFYARITQLVPCSVAELLTCSCFLIFVSSPSFFLCLSVCFVFCFGGGRHTAVQVLGGGIVDCPGKAVASSDAVVVLRGVLISRVDTGKKAVQCSRAPSNTLVTLVTPVTPTRARFVDPMKHLCGGVMVGPSSAVGKCC